MATEVVMPQMGESIAEGTITKWLKNLGEHVERDEPLFEISTDKVDAEIPSPAAGTLTEVKFKEGETVEVNTVVAVLDGAGAKPQSEPEAVAAKEEPTEQAEPEAEVVAAEPAEAAPAPEPTKAESPVDALGVCSSGWRSGNSACLRDQTDRRRSGRANERDAQKDR